MDISSTKKGEILAKLELNASYKIKDTKEAKLILRIHINKNKETGNITLSQCAYSEQMLEYLYITEYKPASTLLSLKIVLTNHDSPSSLKETKEIEDVLYCKGLKSSLTLIFSFQSIFYYALLITLARYIGMLSNKSYTM